MKKDLIKALFNAYKFVSLRGSLKSILWAYFSISKSIFEVCFNLKNKKGKNVFR